jgi:hypothetical protein
MYNRILKRPMFKRGGMGYSHQGTGITSGLDTPRRGLVQHPGGYAGERTLEEINIDKEAIFAPKPYENINDIIASFGVYADAYDDRGEAKTTGEMGWDQAQMIKKIRDERQEKRDLAKLSGLESEEAALIKKQEQDFDMSKLAKGFEYDTFLKNLDQKGSMALAQYQGDVQIKIAELAKQNTATGRRLQANDEMLEQELADAGGLPPGERDKAIAAARAKHKKNKDNIISGSNLMDQALKIAAALAGDSMKNPEDILTDILIIIKGLQSQNLRKGGRVGYQMGTPQTGAMPMQPVQASVTETIDTPGEDMTMTETVTGGQQPTVEMPYQEFRAAIPAEVNDEIVQLIYYNQDAFADFAQISTQADVYAFNNKYGVSLVLPMDTETT